MSLLGALFWTWSAHFSGFTPSRANWRTRGFRRSGQASAGSSSCQTLQPGLRFAVGFHARNDALDIGDLRAAESERTGGSLIGSALCASHARREREEKRQANYANTAAPHTVTGLLVAGDLFADCGLAHLSLCIEGTALTLRLPLSGGPVATDPARQLRKIFFASIPESAGNGLSRASAARPGSPPERSDEVAVPQDRAAFGDEHTKGGLA